LGYNIAAWNSFFGAASPSLAALLGLIITAVTVRVSFMEVNRIAGYRLNLLLSTLFYELVYTLLPLTPIGRLTLGALMASVGLFILMFTSFLLMPSQVLLPGSSRKSAPSRKPRRPRYRFIVVYYSVAVLASPACMLIGGISLAIHAGGGFYWALFGLVFTLYWEIMVVWQVIVGARPLESVIPTLDEPEQPPSGPSGAGPVSG
jgi:hypothetical protein